MLMKLNTIIYLKENNNIYNTVFRTVMILERKSIICDTYMY